MDFFSILTLLGGLALFLYGMQVMGDGLAKVSGGKLEQILENLTSSKWKAVLLGLCVTAVIQSSSATTVMVVGFVNSGIMKLTQAVGIIMGANIGTTITSWILSLTGIQGDNVFIKMLNPSSFSPILAIIGVFMLMLAKSDKKKNVGTLLTGFSILMFGMQTMSGAVAPLKESEAFTNMLTMFSNPLAGILLGIAFTAILQSASAAVGILQALSVTGSLTFATAFPIILGIGVGAACPVLISAIGANKNGQRTALVYLINDLFGMVIWGTVFYVSNIFVHYPFLDMTMSPVAIAIINTAFRAATVCVLFGFIPKIEKLVCKLIKDSPEDLEDMADSADFDLLEERLLAYPALAIGQCRRVLRGMSKNVRKNVGRALDLVDGYERERYNKVQSKEELIDKYETKIGEYLMQLTKREMNTAQTRQVSLYLHIISDLERVGDYASNVARVTNEINESNIELSKEAIEELDVIMGAVRETVSLTETTLREREEEGAFRVRSLSLVVAALAEEMKMRHVTRLSHGDCELRQGTAFNELLNSFERITAHCTGAVTAVIKMEENDPDMHIHSSILDEEQDMQTKEKVLAQMKTRKPILDEYRRKYSID